MMLRAALAQFGSCSGLGCCCGAPHANLGDAAAKESHTTARIHRVILEDFFANLDLESTSELVYELPVWLHRTDVRPDPLVGKGYTGVAAS
jgi:hypothetical protein